MIEQSLAEGEVDSTEEAEVAIDMEATKDEVNIVNENDDMAKDPVLRSKQ